MMGVLTRNMFNRHPQLEPFLHLKPLKGENCDQDADHTDTNSPTSTTASNQSSMKISSPATDISSTYQRQQRRQRMRQRQLNQRPNTNIKHNDDDNLITYYGQDGCQQQQQHRQPHQIHHRQHHHHDDRDQDDNHDEQDDDDDDDDDYAGYEQYSTSASFASSSPPIIRADMRRCCLRANKLAGDLYFPSDSYIEPIMVMYDDLSTSAPDFLTMTTLPSGFQQRNQHQHQQQQQQHYLTLEELKLARQSCSLCGCNWQEDHVSLDCPECDGYALTRPCPDCDGKCKQVWKRNLNGTHDRHKASWDGSCSLPLPPNRHCCNQQQVEAADRAKTEDNQGSSSGGSSGASSSGSSSSVGSDSDYGYTFNLSKLL